MAGGHQQRTQVGVADAKLPVGAGGGGDLLGREVREADRDVHRGDDQLRDLLEPADVEGVAVVQELHQVDAGQVARGIVEVDVFRAISYYRSTNNVGMISGLSEVISNLEALRLAADHADGAVGSSEPCVLQDVGQLGLLAGQAEADEPVEFPDGLGAYPEIVERALGPVADLSSVLPGVVERVSLALADSVDARGDAQRREKFLNVNQQFLGPAPQAHVPRFVDCAPHDASVRIEQSPQERGQGFLWSPKDRLRHSLRRCPAAGHAKPPQELPESPPGDAELQRPVHLAAGLALESGDLCEQGMVARQDDTLLFG